MSLDELIEDVEYCTGDYTAWGKHLGFKVSTTLKQLQANQVVLLEALERIEAMAECPACFCGYPTGTAEIKECAQQTLKAVKDES